MEITPRHQEFLLDAARAAIRSALSGRTQYEVPIPNDPILTMAAGCFVSLHDSNTHRLRGCVGRMQSNEPLLKTLHETAHSALADPRFAQMPISIADLSWLDLEISILAPLEPAANPLDFDPLNDGIYLIINGQTGTFLPQVARETGWGREQLLSRLCTEKLGLAPEAWRASNARLLKYKTAIIGPVPFTPAPVASFGMGNTFSV
jgi:AmmeMemoRadiSam system protein A